MFYEVPGNANGKMSQRVYIDSILNPVIKSCLEAGEEFVLKDGDPGHRKANNIIYTSTPPHLIPIPPLNVASFRYH